MSVERDVSTVEVDRPTAMGAPPSGALPPPAAPIPVLPTVERRRVVTRRTLSIAATLAGVEAIGLLAFGGIVAARAGFDGAWRDPIVSVAGTTATAVAGVLAIVGGALLLAAALGRSRSGVVFLAIVLGVGGIVVAAVPDLADGALGTTSAAGVALAVASFVVAAAALVIPDVDSRRDRVVVDRR